ncbi:MAG: hypothetical protein H7Z16_19920 [Pyrinomonadaceae bacterium]|nr:hypothetical protein [Pyrinomonadaceae bacterium]
MKYILILVLGLALGVGATIFLLGTPRARAVPGARVQAPDPSGDPPATVVVTLGNSFFDGLLGTIFNDLGPPSFQLGSAGAQSAAGEIQKAVFQGGCTNTITLAHEGSNIKTQVQFAGGKVSAPLAFSGSYNLLGNCTQLKGWAATTIELSFDQPKQTLYGRINVEGVNLENVAPFANTFVTVFVRTAIDSRVNPIEILRPQQLQMVLPIKASGGTVKANVKDVRAEVQEGSLRLHITYDFSGTKGHAPQG